MAVTSVGIIKPWNEATVSAGAEIATDGAMQNLDQRTVNDDFDAATIDSTVFQENTAGSGVISSQPIASRAFLDSANASGSVANITRKSAFDDTADFALQTTLDIPIVSSQNVGATLFINTGVPVSAASAAWFAKTAILIWNSGLAAIELLYKDNGGTFRYYNSGTNSWQVGLVGLPSNLNSFALRTFDDSGTQKWQILIYDTDGALIETTPAIAWSATLQKGGGEDYWWVLGSGVNSVAQDITVIYKHQEWPESTRINFLTAAQTCETDPYATDEGFDSDDITVQLGRTPASATEIKVAVNVDGGGFGGFINVDVTPIAGETGLFKFAAGTSFTPGSSVVLKVQLNTPDSDTQLRILSIKINGITIAGGGGGGIPIFAGGILQ